MKLFPLLLSLAALLGGGSALASTVIMSPTVDANAPAGMPQPPNSVVSQIHINTGSIVLNNVGNAGSTDAGPLGSNTTSAWAEANQTGWTWGAAQYISMTTRASANLSTGAITAYVEATRPPTDSGVGPGVGQPSSWLSDTIQFTNSTASTLPLALRYEFQGSVSATDGLSWPTQANGAMEFQIQAAGDSNQVKVAVDGQPAGYTLNGFFNQDEITNFNGGLGFGQVGQFMTAPYGSNVGALVTTTLLVPPGQSYLGIRAYLELSCITNVCDFGQFGQVGNGGLIRFGDLPPGLSYTSASGTFLSAVPLPAAFWLMLSGLGVLGSVARRNRQPK